MMAAFHRISSLSCAGQCFCLNSDDGDQYGISIFWARDLSMRYAWLPKAYKEINNDPSAFADEEEAMIRLGVRSSRNQISMCLFTDSGELLRGYGEKV